MCCGLMDVQCLEVDQVDQIRVGTECAWVIKGQGWYRVRGNSKNLCDLVSDE